MVCEITPLAGVAVMVKLVGLEIAFVPLEASAAVRW
jgi:hypothetical protein